MGLAGLGLGLTSAPAAAEHGDSDQPWYHWDDDVDAQTNALRRLGALEMAANDEAITDFAGENLQIDDGVLEAAGRGVDVVDIDDYGADPTGEEPSDDALAAAIDDLEDGDYLLITNGEYWFDDAHEIYNDHVTVLGTGSKLRISGAEYGAYAHWLSFGDFTAVSDFSGDTRNAEDASEGDQSIEVVDPSPFSAGDDITIAESKYNNEPTLSWGGTAGRGNTPTRAVIREIGGSTLYLDRGLNYDYDAGNAGVFLLDSVVGGRFVDLHMAEGDGEDASEGFLMCAYARDCQFINCVSEEYVGFPFTDIHSLRTLMVDCEAKNPIMPSRASSHWEPFQFRGSTDATVVRPSIDTCRRGIDINAGSKVVRIFDPRIRNAYLHGMCFHSNATQPVYGAYEVYGGRVEAAEEVLHDKYHFGAGLSMSPNQSHVKVFGTTVVGRSRAIHTPYGQAENLVLEGCTLETFESDPAESDTLRTSATHVINGNLANSRLENVDVVSRGGNDNTAINLNGAEGVSISGSVSGTTTDDVVYVGNAENVTLDVDVLDNDDVGVNDVTIENSRNVTVRGRLHGQGRSVATTGNATDVRIVDVDAQGDAAPIGHVGEDGTVARIRVMDCNTVGGENGDIDFETEYDSEIGGLWIKNNACDQIRFHGSAGDGDKFVRDNLTGLQPPERDDEMAGEGTEEDPYVITNAAQLQAMDEEPDAHYVLGNDVDASETADWDAGAGFVPVSGFSGSLDGDGHAIEGLHIDRPASSMVGLFSEIQSGSAITNLALVDVTVSGGGYTGGLAGIGRDADVQNVSLSGSVSGGRRTGGILGLQQGLVEEVHVDADVSSDSALVGGISGDLEGTIRNSSTAGSVAGDHETGGISGWNNGGVIEDSHTDATVTGETHSIGGLSGIVIYGGTISNSSAEGDVSGSSFVGGFTGVVYDRSPGARVETSSASGSVTGDEAVGGFAGAALDEVEDCYAEGSAHATDNQAGSFAGEIGDGASVTRSYGVGAVSGGGDVGGLAGTNSGTLADSYWDTETTGQSNSVGSGDPGGEGLTTDEMTGEDASTNMSALDFSGTWATTDSYPVLQWQTN